MENLRLSLSVRRLAAGLILALGTTGCLTTESSLLPHKDGHHEVHKEAPPKPAPCSQVVATWSNKVYFVPDIVNQGAPMPGVLGRVYLFGQTVGYPQTGDGMFVAEIYDDTSGAPGGVLLERWNIDKDTARKMLSKDTIGWGYTMYLPWATFRQDITKVHMMLRFESEKGQALYAASGPLTLSLDSAPMAVGGAGPIMQTGAKGQPRTGNVVNANAAQPATANQAAPTAQQSR